MTDSEKLDKLTVILHDLELLEKESWDTAQVAKLQLYAAKKQLRYVFNDLAVSQIRREKTQNVSKKAQEECNS